MKRHWMVIAVMAGSVVFQLALVASYTATYARPVLHDVTIGLVGPSPTQAGDVGPVSDKPVATSPYPMQRRHVRRSATGAYPPL